jgi:hypothetical protein
VCLATLTFWGCGEASSVGPLYGLWAGNVETLPSQPTQLPAVFFEEAPAAAAVPVGSQGRPLLMEPARINKPLWIFADQVDLQSLSDTIHAAQAADRPIVIIHADPSSIEDLFGRTTDTSTSNDPAYVAWAWLPWMTDPPTRSTLLIADNEDLSDEELQWKYYAFMVGSTLQLELPDTIGSN